MGCIVSKLFGFLYFFYIYKAPKGRHRTFFFYKMFKIVFRCVLVDLNVYYKHSRPTLLGEQCVCS